MDTISQPKKKLRELLGNFQRNKGRGLVLP